MNAARVCHNGDQGGRGRLAGGPKRNENCQITSVEWNLAYCKGNSNVTLASAVTIQIHETKSQNVENQIHKIEKSAAVFS